MKPVPFTQFLRPNGQQRPTSIGRPDPIAALAHELLGAGCRLETEVLATGEISMTVEHGEETIAIEIVENGPAVLEAVDKLICDAHRMIRDRKPSSGLQTIGDAFSE